MSARSLALALPLPRMGRLRLRPLAWLLRADADRRARRALAELDPHLLADIGLTVEQAMAEASRAAWDAPAHWQR